MKIIMRVLILIMFFLCSNFVNANDISQFPNLNLSIETDKKSYSVGEEIIINYTIENTSENQVGFYIASDRSLTVFVKDVSGKDFEYYYDQAAQRMMSSIYPDEYVFLEPNGKWEGTQKLVLQKGEIKTYDGSKIFFKWRVVHNGYYLTCPMGCSNFDNILLSESKLSEIKIVAKHITGNPNPRSFAIDDCKNSNISLDLFPQEAGSSKIYHSIQCEGDLCNEFSNFHENPRNFNEMNDLGIFCQHYSALTKTAWEGTLESNSVKIHLF